jgi:hypothetical protein
LAQLNQAIIKGLSTAMPSAGGAGRLYFTTDTNQVFYDDGTTWDNVSPSGGGGSGVTSLNSLTGALNITAGSNVTITPSGSSIEIAASGGGGGGISTQFGTANPNGTDTPALVQSANAGQSATVSTTSAVTEGNLLIVAAGANNSPSTTTVSDTLGTSYTLLSFYNVHTMSTHIWAGVAPSSGANTVTITGSGDGHMVTSILEFSGCTIDLDGAVQTEGSSGSPTTSQSITTTVTSDLLIATYADPGGNNTGSMGTGWTTVFFNGDGDWWDFGLAYQIAPTIGTYSGAWTLGYNEENGTTMLALRAGGTSLSGSEGDLYFQTSPYTGYVYHDSAWNQFS